MGSIVTPGNWASKQMEIICWLWFTKMINVCWQRFMAKFQGWDLYSFYLLGRRSCGWLNPLQKHPLDSKFVLDFSKYLVADGFWFETAKWQLYKPLQKNYNDMFYNDMRCNDAYCYVSAGEGTKDHGSSRCGTNFKGIITDALSVRTYPDYKTKSQLFYCSFVIHLLMTSLQGLDHPHWILNTFVKEFWKQLIGAMKHGACLQIWRVICQ